MKASNTYQRGVAGEARAANYLRLRGYRILERNWRVPVGEIDLIVRRGRALVFVEVKLRRSRGKGSPLEAVHAGKIRRISAAAACYLTRGLPAGVKECRFDVLGVGPEQNLLGQLKVEHIRDAFEASGNFNI